MKSIWVAIALAVSISWAQASLEEIFAPLPEVKMASRESKVEAAAAKPSVRSAPAEKIVPITAEDLRLSIEEALRERLRPVGNLELTALRDLPDLSMHSQPFIAQLLTVPEKLSRSNFLMRFQVENEQGVIGEWNVPFSARLYSNVWYSRSYLRPGDLATPADFEARRIDLLVESEAVPANAESLAGNEYSRSVSPGKALVWSDLKSRSLVRRGDLVEVFASKGLMAITMRAIARQDGVVGEFILLRNVQTSKEFAARVVGKNRVEVVF